MNSLNHAKIVSLCLHLLTSLREVTSSSNLQKFPEYFKFGAGSAAYQVEGAWDVDGRGPSIWDYRIHSNQVAILDGSDADVASNSYYLYKNDVSMLKYLGVQAYRFSISWSRILPNGRKDYVNQLGIDYYNNVINELLANGIEPFVTIYHFDLPQTLSEEGGWSNENSANWFEDYAEIVFKNFGDRVKNWFTMNEPYVHCYMGYELGLHPPNIVNPGVGVYECTRNLILANAHAYRLYEKKFKETQKGQVGLVISLDWGEPASDTEEDIQAAADYVLFTFDLLVHPIFSKEGNYPEQVIKKIAMTSARQGYTYSRLRPFTQEQVNFIKGSADFLGLNHYSTSLVYRSDNPLGKFFLPLLYNDIGVGIKSSSDTVFFLPTAQNSVDGEPSGMYKCLIYIQNNYGMPVYITENGYSSRPGLEDDGRVNYIQNYLNATLAAISDGANVRGYFVWSLMDNFEWTTGYLVRYGLYEINFNDPNRDRIPRKSAHAYKNIVSTRMSYP